MTPAGVRVFQTLYRSRGMVSSALRRMLATPLPPDERKLFQELDAAVTVELDAYRSFLEGHGALHTMHRG